MNKFQAETEWEIQYNSCKGQDWPSCPSLSDIDSLPLWIKEELKNKFQYDPFAINREIFYTDLRKFQIYYQFDNDGGGTTFGQEFIRVLKFKYPDKKFNFCYEWCSGPGFIGYSILEHGLCENLFLTDLWDPALNDAECTRNNLPLEFKDKVTIQLIKDIALIPEKYKFDLVVSNPPHARQELHFNFKDNRICTDLNWKSHENFFGNIAKNLADNGRILLQEHSGGSSTADFEEMIMKNNLKIIDCFSFDDPIYEPIYYIEIGHA